MNSTVCIPIPKALAPVGVGVLTYLIANRFFPEKVEAFEKDPLKDLKDDSKRKLVKKIVKKILKDKALKIALLSIFSTAGIINFQSEIETLLINESFYKYACFADVEGELKTVCDIIIEHELDLHTKPVRWLIAHNQLNSEEKISLLKIKLDFILNGECSGKRRFLVVTILGVVIAFSVSGVGGLSLILEALYRLFKEGKIKKALYYQIRKTLLQKYGLDDMPVPVEELLN
jgi:hypothetical protein